MSQRRSKSNEGYSSEVRSFIFDFKHVFNVLGKGISKFDFYPGGLRGFIESCVLASQRRMDSELRAHMCLNDIRTALTVRVAEQIANNEDPIDTKYCLEQVIGLAETVNDYVYRELMIIHEELGPYSISNRDLKWSRLNGLVVRVLI